jgi:caa(3)-type oxidase subunit IV
MSAEELPAEHFNEKGEYIGPAFTAKDKKYIKIFALLFVMTAAEVAMSYIPGFDGKKAAFALPMMAVAGTKFAVVAGYFMHLKMDSPLMRRLFIIGAVLAGFCYVAVLNLFGKFTGAGPWLTYIAVSVVLIAVWVIRGDDGVVKGVKDDDAPALHPAH